LQRASSRATDARIFSALAEVAPFGVSLSDDQETLPRGQKGLQDY
jgi:hypothetical protein